MAFYRTVHTCGAGNKGAQFLYELLRISGYPAGTDHFYTISVNERDGAYNLYGYINEGIACHVFPTQASGTTPLFRLLNPQNGDHFYTTSAAERAVALGWHHLGGMTTKESFGLYTLIRQLIQCRSIGCSRCCDFSLKWVL
jgi:hypothetical protein